MMRTKTYIALPAGLALLLLAWSPAPAHARSKACASFEIGQAVRVQLRSGVRPGVIKAIRGAQAKVRYKPRATAKRKYFTTWVFCRKRRYGGYLLGARAAARKGAKACALRAGQAVRLAGKLAGRAGKVKAVRGARAHVEFTVGKTTRTAWVSCRSGRGKSWVVAPATVCGRFQPGSPARYKTAGKVQRVRIVGRAGQGRARITRGGRIAVAACPKLR